MVRFNEHLGARLGALVDGELAHDDRDRALAHLAGCSQCRTLVDSERSLKSQLSAMPMPEPSARLMASLFQIPQTEVPPTPPQDGPPPQVGGFLGRSSAFLPEFAVGLRPIGDLPDNSPHGGDSDGMNRVRALRSRPLSLAEASFLGRTLPSIR
jgi:anti-sigma factor RsiW